MTEPPIELRPANARDVDFIAELIELTMHGYVEATWGAFDRALTRANVAEAVAAGHSSIVRLGDENIGVLTVEREASHIQLAQIYVVPAYQNRGVGTALVRRLADEARATGKPLRARVLAVNPARRLYEREGFVVTAETPERVFMERRAPVIVRLEGPQDVEAIRRANVAAFADHPYGRQTEHLIVEALRAAGALEVSLVAELDGSVVGHIAFSRARIGDGTTGWYLLGPVAVLPAFQGRGIGRALVEAGLGALHARGAHGCVLVGDPAFYTRFGFAQTPGVTCAGVPDENVLCLRLAGTTPAGEVRHHPAFSIALGPAPESGDPAGS